MLKDEDYRHEKWLQKLIKQDDQSFPHFHLLGIISPSHPRAFSNKQDVAPIYLGYWSKNKERIFMF